MLCGRPRFGAAEITLGPAGGRAYTEAMMVSHTSAAARAISSPAAAA
jgi:hypothetical protein